jgi:hypothetical protein
LDDEESFLLAFLSPVDIIVPIVMNAFSSTGAVSIVIYSFDTSFIGMKAYGFYRRMKTLLMAGM